MRRNFRNNKGFRGSKQGYGLNIENKQDEWRKDLGQPKEGEPNDMLAKVAYRDLFFTGNIEPKADPYTEAARSPYPYPISARFNPVQDVNYPGDVNILGNSIVRLQNSVNTMFYTLFDGAQIYKRINYLYMPITVDSSTNLNKAVTNEYLTSFNQALSFAYSTMTTQLPFYTDAMDSDLPYPGTTKPSANSTFMKMAALIHYQTVLQNAISPLAKYVETRAMEQYMMNVSNRVDAAQFVALYGLLKKKNFYTGFNSIATICLTEYFDLNWYRQMNVIRSFPSKRANDIQHQLETIVTTHAIPSLKLYSGSDTDSNPYYDSASALSVSVAMPTTDFVYDGSVKQYPLEQVIYMINYLLDVNTMLRWTRLLGTTGLPEKFIPNANTYMDAIYKLLIAVRLVLGRFSDSMTEVRTFIDKLSSSGMVYWKKGCYFNVDRQFTQYNMKYNLLLDSIFRQTYGGSNTLTFDSSTRRWSYYTPWDMYTGLPKFDKISGAAFLMFSFRSIPNEDTAGNTISPEDTNMIIPVLFNENVPSWVGNKAGWLLNRLGLFASLQVTTIDDVTTDPILSRLNPNLDSNLSVNVPTTNIEEDNPDADPNAVKRGQSSVLRALTQMFGYGRDDSNTGSVTLVDPDFIGFIDLQLADVTNAMITYTRNYSPFRVQTPNPKRTMGFGLGGLPKTDIK